MGQHGSKQRSLFVDILKSMLQARGAKVTGHQLQVFLDFIEDVCPWFPEEGTVNPVTWEKVGKRLREYYQHHGPEKVPIDTFSLWNLIRDCLDPCHELQKLKKAVSMLDLRSLSKHSSIDDPQKRKLVSGVPPMKVTLSDSEDELDPQDEEDLEEAAARYHHDDDELVYPILHAQPSAPPLTEAVDHVTPQMKRIMQPPNPLQELCDMLKKMMNTKDAVTPYNGSPYLNALKQAKEQGEAMHGFEAFPVVEVQDQQGNFQRRYDPLPYKLIKELKQACAQYGATSPFTLSLVETISTDSLPPRDWRSIAKACLSGGDYLLWRTEYSDRAKDQAERNRNNNLAVTFDMLMGEGAYGPIAQQIQYPAEAYAQISTLAAQAWKKLPTQGNRTEELSKIRQGPDEPYQDFVSRLLQAVNKVVVDGEAGMLLVRQLAYENANAPCQAAIRPWRLKGDLTDYIRLCADIGPSYTQGVALAAALSGKTVKEFLLQRGRGTRARGRGRGNQNSGGGCFRCGQPGHMARACPAPAPAGNYAQPALPAPPRTPGLCPRCRRGNHWKNECKSKYDNLGRPLPALPAQGNGKWGQPRPQQTIGAMTLIPNSSNPFLPSQEPQQGAQDWTSVPPPTSY